MLAIQAIVVSCSYIISDCDAVLLYLPLSANTVAPSVSLLSPHDSSRALHIQLKDVFKPLLEVSEFLGIIIRAERSSCSLSAAHIFKHVPTSRDQFSNERTWQQIDANIAIYR